MARFEKTIDVYFTDNGDFFLGENGELEDTSLDAYQGMVQRVHTRMMSSPGDWATQPSLGVGLSAYLGKKNTRETADTIKAAIYSELTQDDLLRASEFIVDILPISDTQIAIAIIISQPGLSGKTVLTYTYDMRDNKIMLRSL